MSTEQPTQKPPPAEEELNLKNLELEDNFTKEEIINEVGQIRCKTQKLKHEYTDLLQRCEALSSSKKSATDDEEVTRSLDESIADIQENLQELPSQLSAGLEELEGMFKEHMREELVRFEQLCDKFMNLASENGVPASTSVTSVIDQIINRGDILHRSSSNEDSEVELVMTEEEGTSQQENSSENKD